VWRHARPAIFVAGATAGVLSALPGLSLLFPLWMALNGIAAVSIYRRRSGFSRLRRSAGAKLGALAGLVASVMYALCTTLAFVVHGTEMRAEMQRQLQIRLQAADPQAQAVFHWFLSPAGFATLIVLTLFIFLLGFVLLGAAAGAWWATTKARPKKQ
jgi:ABC-type multidrug transport system fused ATPase/permease subunit